MITCSKCNNAFLINWREISKDSIAVCPECKNECVVKLFDLQNSPCDTTEGFSSIEYEKHFHDQRDSEKMYIFKHVMISLSILTVLLILFISGILNISILDEKFPAVAAIYKKINVISHKILSVEEVKIKLINEKSMLVDINIKNELDTPELLHDVEILVLDPYNNAIAATQVKSNMIIKNLSSVHLKINVTPINDVARYVVIIVNGKTMHTSKIDTANKKHAE